jgi:hypothetical protein
MAKRDQFTDHLDHDVASREPVERGGAFQPAQDLRLPLGRDLALLHALGQEGLDLAQPLLEQLVAHLADDDLVPRLGADLGDAGAHEPATDDSDGFDVHSQTRGCCVAPPRPPARSAGMNPATGAAVAPTFVTIPTL